MLVAAALSIGGVTAVDAVQASPAQAADQTVPGVSDPSVTVTAPTAVPVGEDIVISGTGWVTEDGGEGSVIGIKLDDGGVSTKLDVTTR